jgi:hypothetical protein
LHNLCVDTLSRAREAAAAKAAADTHSYAAALSDRLQQTVLYEACHMV